MRVFNLPCVWTVTVLLAGLNTTTPANGAEKILDRPAPSFSRETLNHTKLTLSSFRGRVVLLNFWASWCAPCALEIPRFIEWQKQFGGQGLQIVGVSMDDDAADARAAVRKYGVNYPVVVGDARLGELYGGILGLPVTFLIDRSGKVRYQHQGVADLSVIQREIQALLRAH